VGPDGRYYTSNIGAFNNPGDGTIVVLEGNPFDGEVITSRFVTGLNDPLGSVFVDSMLYVVDRNMIRAIETEGDAAGEMTVVVARQAFPIQPQLLNDLTVNADGVFFASDSNRGLVYQIELDDNIEIILDADSWPTFGQPNGVLVDVEGHLSEPGTLLVLDIGSGELLGWSPEQEVFQIAESLGSPDGMAFDELGNLYISDNGGGRIWRLQPNGALEVIVDRLTTPADIGFDLINKLLLIPSIVLQTITVVRI
jgi:sugar lactone lactonase YvrE